MSVECSDLVANLQTETQLENAGIQLTRVYIGILREGRKQGSLVNE